MADTMKFGPEWLRALSDGSTPTAPVPAPSSKFKMADYRYGREEMLALFQPPYKPPAYIQQFSQIYVEDTQTPICLLPLSEDEERLMAHGVNSVRTGRGGGPPLRGGRGGAVDRGRGRGRGRGEGYSIRGPVENGDMGGGFGRPWAPNKDGWEEVGNRKLDRGYSRPFDDMGREGHPRYSRSMSSDNWRDKGPVEDDDEGDWRKAGNRERWSTRTNWREPGRGGSDMDRRNGAFTRGRGFESDDRGRRLGDPREPDDVPEWADDGADDVGTFDSSGAFVSNKERPHFHDHRAERDPSRELAEPPQEKEAVRIERKEPPAPAEPPQQQEDSPPRRNDSSSRLSTSSQLSNGTGSSPQQGTGGAVSPVPPPENGISAQVASLVAAARSAAPMLPSMPQGVTLANIISDEKTEAKNAAATSMTDENALKWLYTDPQGEIQGPFMAEEMAQWFSAGYFTMNLLVKRGCDEQFQPLGELMKRWGHVPFLPGTPPPPILKTNVAAEPAPLPVSTQPAVSLQAPAPTPTPTPSFSLGQGGGGTETLLVQQQLMLQHQILQVQMSMRQLQMQTLAQLQEQDTFKALDPTQQQQLSLQMMQSNPLVLQHMQQLQQLQHLQQQTQQQQQQISQGPSQPTSAASVVPLQPQSQTPQPGVDVSLSASPPNFQRSISQPAPTNEGQGDIPSIWGTAPPAGGWSNSQPGSVWELDNGPVPQAVKSDLEKLRQEKEAEFVRMMEEERKRQEEIQKQQEELRRQTEALQREKERMEREKEELERQRQLELQRVEEIRRLKEEEQKRREMEEAEAERLRQEELVRHRRMEEQRRKEEEHRVREEERRREEERQKRQEEEDRKKQEELRRKREAEEKALEELKRMEEMRRQQEAEKQRQRDAEKQQQEAEVAQRKQQQEFQRQQQEALKRLQQQQAMQNIQLPSSANWARQQQAGQGGSSRPLAEIQQEEELKQLQQQKERQELMRIQQEHLVAQQQQQQQQQKSWASNLPAQQPPRGKSLAEIQEEQERQLLQERQKQQQHHQHQAKTMSLSQAAVWGSGPSLSSSSSASSAPWTGAVWASDASIWGSAPAPQPAPTAKRSGKDNNTIQAEFPALRNPKSNKSKQAAAKTAPPKPKKEEEAVQRLFKDPVQKKDEFTVWCEKFLSGMETQIDIETFVSFLQAVESPYEVHDYVKNYLGEGKNAREFAKQFLEKRSHYKNKARNEKRQEEESIWGPAPALNPRETRGATQTSASDGFTEVGGKSKGGKKKKKMQKLDGSALLGFTVEKDPNRKNAGEIESVE